MTSRTGACVAAAAAAFRVETASVTDPGCRRWENEDAVLCLDPPGGRLTDGAMALLVVADGLGGHQAGAVASALATAAIGRAVKSASADPADLLRSGIEAANAVIFRCGHRVRAFRGMGTTCAALALSGAEAVCAHVGDSRVYLLRDGQLYAMTQDHSCVQALVGRRVLTSAEAERHESRHVIDRAVGTQRQVMASAWPHPMRLQDGDLFILCSDGLYTMVTEAEMIACADDESAAVAARRLVALACLRGAPDNVTVAIAAVREQS